MQNDNGREFVNVIIKEILLLYGWGTYYQKNDVKMASLAKIINGCPRHPQSQRSVGRCNQDVKNMLISWLQDNNIQNWSLGCCFVQCHKNSSHHRIIDRFPYKILFEVDFSVSLYSTNLPRETVDDIFTEELERVVNEHKNNDSTSIDNIIHLESQENKLLSLQNININNLSVIIDDNLPVNNTIITQPYNPDEKKETELSNE